MRHLDKHQIIRCLVVGLLTLSAVNIQAEEIKTPVMTQGDRQSMNLPKNGMDKSSVESSYGSPSHVKGPVGTPPITTWEYPGFLVYFEGNSVIHSVLKPAK